MMLRFVYVCFGVALIQAAHGDNWEGKGTLGYVLVDGNTESETLNVGLDFNKETDRWTHEALLASVRASRDGVESTENYTAGWRSEYGYSDRAYVFGDLRYFDDQFDSYTGIITGAFGVGYKALDREFLTWNVSAGLGYQDTEHELTGEEDSGIAYLLESDYEHHVSDSTDIGNYTRVEIAENSTFSQNVMSVSVAMTETLALAINFDVRHNSDPEPGFKSVIRITSVNVVYSFGGD